ncbi:MAG: heparan-alpha-glucosaminide N-acetyltransferase domain-containing protein [Pyrinomonadaceae bacterium]
MTSEAIKQRIYSIDLLRGIVMMIMLLDHTREFVHAGALTSDPTNPETTTVPIFFTRWITHFCAPAFVFLSGVSIYLQKSYGKSNRELAWFLVTRGLWLVLLEFTVVRLGIVFNLDYSFFGLAQVIWVIGVSMIIMAAVIYLPLRITGVVSVATIVLHNLLDGFAAPLNIAFGGTPPPTGGQILWFVLHQQAFIPLPGDSMILMGYPLIPWVAVMAAGYAFGPVYNWSSDVRQRWILIGGAAMTALFVILRLINIYGDPVPWRFYDNAAATVLSFFNVSKYPPSLLFLLMTLGPSLIVLAIAERVDGRAVWQRVAITFGRVPMFYYILQWFTAHGFGVVLGLIAGKDVGYLFLSIIAMGQSAPPDYGFSLAVTYGAWIAGLVLLYPLCVWWGKLKQRKKHWIFSYI